LSTLGLAPLLVGQMQFRPANYDNNVSRTLKLFPAGAPAAVIKIPFRGWPVKFSGDGRSLYAATGQSLVRIDYNPLQSTPVKGTQGFEIVKGFAVTQDNSKVVISGIHRERGIEKCGLFAITVSTGVVSRILGDDCGYQWTWNEVTVSPDGARAVAEYGSGHGHRLDLIDLVHGSTKSLGDLSRPTWSPDGRWVAAINWNSWRLVLLDANDFSHRRDIGSTIEAAWSPDSRYLLLWKYRLFKCGFGLDVEPPASLDILEVASGKRYAVPSSECQLVEGPIGWLVGDIHK